ncbi:hypothetical protein AB663_002850 [Microbacterium sp. XT11]|nr:hypothetical protein AB663_002850 [Microbacterium sp. XT11]
MPPAFSDDAPTVRMPVRRRRRLLTFLAVFAVCIGGAAAAQVAASAAYDRAAQAFSTAMSTLGDDVQQLRGYLRTLQDTVSTARVISDRSPAPLVDPAAVAPLSDALQKSAVVAGSAETLLDRDVPEAPDAPFWFWDLFAAATQVDQARGHVDDLDTEITATAPSLLASRAEVSDAGLAVLSTSAAAAATFETAHVSARNDDVVALRAAASDVASRTSLDHDAASAFGTLQDAAAQVLSSEQAELAEKAGPLLSARLEVEAFARSLAPGVLLEFDWSPVVNGAGNGGSMGGLTTWWWDDPDRAAIQLSDSVAERWPSYSSKSLVAHEVGHAISVKCEGMYDASTQDSIEKWATAWAIGMGYTDDANGVWAYGFPPQAYIDAASGCR